MGIRDRQVAAPMRGSAEIVARLALVAVLVGGAMDPAAAHRCTGDCDASDTVTIQELIQGVRIALGQLQLRVCYPFDVDLDNGVSIDELQVAVGNLFSYCGHGSPPTPTSTRTPTSTDTPTAAATASVASPTATPTATAAP